MNGNQFRGNNWIKFIVLLVAAALGAVVLFCGVAALLFGMETELQQPALEIEKELDEQLLYTYGVTLMERLDFSDEENIQGLDALDGGNIRYTVARLDVVRTPVEETGKELPADETSEEPPADETDEEPLVDEVDEGTSVEETGGEVVEELVETILYSNDASVTADNCLVRKYFAPSSRYRYNVSSFFNALRGAELYYRLYYAKDEGGMEYEPENYVIYLSVRNYLNEPAETGSVPADNLLLRGGLYDYTACQAGTFANRVCSFRNMHGVWFGVSCLLFMFCFGFLMSAAGMKKEDGGVHMRWVDRIPFGLYFLAFALLEFAAIFMLTVFVNELGDNHLLSVEFLMECIALLVVLGVFFGLVFCMGVAVRIKAKQFWRYTLLYCVVRPLAWMFKMIKSNVPLFAKGLAMFLFLSILELLMLAWGDDWGLVFVGFCAYKLAEIPLFVYVLYQMNLLKKGGMRVAAGEYGEPIDTRRMLWEFKKHGENINNAGLGISRAVEERMKSERFKTELITNVSHDIKTPLTSIINYVDLMKKEEIESPVMQEYVDVLDRQSARLKKLIEDLMEASKASTGNLPVNYERCDATVMLGQVVGEFEERAGAVGLELIVNAPQPPVYIMADGRHLWRIIDNLMGNICKYAMPNTRVYIELEVFHGMVILTFKNISRCQLNIPSEELMGRFVRGDSSRNTEGSGLGLSIAQSLATLMNGNMAIMIDGDLFKAIVSFPEAQEQ